MKKWLVGLVAAGLCAAGALADSVTYTVANKAVSVTAGTAPEGSEAAYSQTYSTSGQATAGNSMTLTLTGYDGASITGLTLSMHSNAGRGAGSLVATSGGTEFARIDDAPFSDEGWNGAFSSSFVPIRPEVIPMAVPGGAVEIVITASVNSLYVESYTIEYTTEPLKFSIGLDPAEYFEVVQGEPATITAIPQYAQGAVDYVWGAEGVPGTVEGNVFAIDSTDIGGPYTVTCDANDGTSVAEQQTVSFSIVPAPAVYDVEVVQGAGGTVSVEPASGVAGTEIAVTAEPDEGYRLVEILVDGVALAGNTFALPEGGATVSATFELSLERTAVYTVASKTEVTESGDVPGGSSATYEQTANNVGQVTANNTFKLTLKGYEGATLTGLVLSMRSNAKAGSGSLSVTCGDAVITSIADSKFNSADWHGAWSTSYVDVTPAVTPTVVDDDIVLLITGSENSLYCQSVAVTYEIGSAMFSVALDPAEDFEVVEGAEATVTATAKNALGEVTYAWTVAGTPAETDGPELALPTDTVGGPYEVVCVATDGGAEGVTASASVKYTVVAAPQAYTVAVADGIENGSVAVYDGETELAVPTDVVEGTVLTVVATPATRSYKVESVSVTGESSGAIDVAADGSFTMPSENVVVSATFAPWEGTAYALVESMDDFEVGADYLVVAVSEGNYTSAMKNEYVSGYTGRIAVDETVAIDGGAIVTEDDSLVWTIGAGASDGVYTLYNAAAGVYVAAPSSASINEALLVEDGTGEAAQWTIAIETNSLATIGSYQEGKSLQRNSTSNNKFFANYKGGTKPYLFKKVGAGVFSVALDPAEDFDVIQDEEASIAAAVKNAVGDVTYAWTVDGVAAETDGPVLPLPTDGLGPHEVVCVATDAGRDGETTEARVSYTVVEAPKQYTVTIAEGIENGSVALNLDGTPVETPIALLEGTEITVEAIPDGGFKLEAITVNGEPIEGDTFVLAGDSEVAATFAESSVKYATYTVVSTSAVENHGDVPEESEAVYASTYNTVCQLIGGTHMTLTLKGYEGATITGLTLSMKSNARGGAGSLEAVCGDAVITAIADSRFNTESWYGRWSTSYVDITPAVTSTVVDGDVVITISASANSIYCESFTVEYEPGTPVFSVALDPAEDFEVLEGEEASITATAKNAAGEVTYAWTVDGVAAETDGPVLALPTDGLGAHVVVCTATDTGAEGVTAEATVSYTVVPAPVPYAVTIADGIENGSVALELDGTPIETPIDLLEGTDVTVVATPDGGFALEAILVNGEPIEGDTFTVAGATEVSATFAEIVDYATLPFLAEGTPFTGPWQNPDAAGVTSEGLDTDYTSGEGRGAKFDSPGDWVQVKFAGTPETLSYALKGNGTSADCVFVVQESATGAEEDWTTLATYPTEENPLSQTMSGFTNELSAESRYVRFLYVTKAVGNVALYDLYISTADFSVALDLEDGTEFEQNAAASVTATARHAAGEVTYAWTVDGVPAETDGPVLALPTDAVGEHAVVCVATDAGADGATAEASATYTVVPPKPTYAVVIADGILNGYVEADVEEAREGDTVTLTASPEPGYKLGTLTVSYGEESLEFTSSPAEFAMPAMEVLVTASFVERGEAFVKITSLDGLEEGEYVITGAAPDGEYAMLAQLPTSGTPHIMQSEAPMAIEVDTIEGPADSIVWTLAKTDDGWTIHNDAVGFVGYLAGGNSAGAEEEASAKSTWTISESDGLFLAQNVGNTSRYLLYNIGSTRFACYTTPSSSFVPLALYKKSGPAVFTVDVDKTGFEVRQGTPDSVIATAKNGAEPYTYAWSSETPELNGTGPELAIPGTLEPGDYTVTVTSTDSSAEPQTASVDVEFTVVAPPPVFTVTVADGIENGSVTVDKTEAEEGETVTVTATPAENYKLEAILVNGSPIEGNTFEIAGDSVVSATFAAIVKYPVTIDDAIEHGTVAADKAEAEAGETVTLSCEHDDGWKLETYLLGGEPIVGNTFEMPEGEAVVSAVFTEIVLVTYVPVESAADLVAGEEYLVVAHKDGGFTSALKNENNGTRIGLDEVTIAEDGSIATDNAAIVWEIRAGAEDGEYVLYNAAAGVYAAAVSDGNTAQVLADGADPLAQWTIDLADAPAVKIASVAYPSRWLQRNTTPNNQYFAAYTGSQTTPALYKKAGPAVFSITLDPADEFFEVEQGSEAFLTATPHNEEGIVGYEWIVEGTVSETTGNVLALDTTETGGPYKVTCIATDGAGEKAYANAIYSVVPAAVRYQVAIDETIENGEVTADKATAAEGETVTVTATAAPGYELVAITVDGEPIEGDTFEMPAKDVVVSATFAEVVDYAVLPFIDKDTPYPGPWKTATIAGLTHNGLDPDYNDGSAKFRAAGAWMQIKFQGTPGTLSFGIKGNGTDAGSVSTFAVLESADGETWTDVAVFASHDNLTPSRQDVGFALSEDSRYVQFLYREKGSGNVGIYDVYISAAGEEEPSVTVTGETTLMLGGTFELALALENYTGGYAWAWEPATIGYVDPDTATFWWTPTKAGDTDVTFSAKDGDRMIASATVTLVVEDEPAPVPPEITKMEIDAEGGIVTLEFTGDGAAVYGTDDLADLDSWAPVEDALLEGNIALVPMDKPFLFLRVQ